MIETLLGGLLGGIFRIAPEFMKMLDRKNERNHELKMTELQIETVKIQGQFRLEESKNQMTIAELNAMSEAFKEQAETAKASYKWVAAVSALVRPSITLWIFALYSIAKITSMITALQNGSDALQVLVTCWGVEDMAMLNLVLTFWFVGRVYERK